MKTIEELAQAVIAEVREISPTSKISDEDVACIAGITMSIMCDEAIANTHRQSTREHHCYYPKPCGTRMNGKCELFDPKADCPNYTATQE